MGQHTIVISTQPDIWSRGIATGASPASARIVELVRAALFRGELKPGDMLGSETDLARRLGVSRVPVRDAFKSLQAMGIVEVKMGAHGGARIAVGDPTRFADALAVQFKLVGMSAEEMFEAEIAVEGAAAMLAARNATAEDLAALRAILAELAALVNEAQGFTRAGLRFHLRVVEASHNRALIAYEQALIDVLYDTYAPQTTPALARGVIAKHTRVYRSIAARDGAKASAAITAHLHQVRERVLADIHAGTSAHRG